VRESAKSLSEDRRSQNQDLNPGPPEYEAGALSRPRRSVPTFVPFVREIRGFYRKS
jgi:hypothetical protein